MPNKSTCHLYNHKNEEFCGPITRVVYFPSASLLGTAIREKVIITMLICYILNDIGYQRASFGNDIDISGLNLLVH